MELLVFTQWPSILVIHDHTLEMIGRMTVVHGCTSGTITATTAHNFLTQTVMKIKGTFRLTTGLI